ncbi:MAG TPA: class II glutamine amidotransferase [Pseudomonas sp.]|nr:class II glutamine amidotransferase [Pseudomonas sp.]
MCELLGMSSRLPARLTSSLMSLVAHAGGASRNRDGWGIALYAGRDVALFKEASPASESPLVPLLLAGGPATTLALGHIRHATQGAISLANTAPFTRDLAGRTHVFAHNGNLHGIDFQLGLGEFQPIGETDSEQAFCALLGRLKELYVSTEMPALKPRLDVIASFAIELRRHGPANFIYADGDALFAHADRRLQLDTGLVTPPALYLWQTPASGFTKQHAEALSVVDVDRQPVTLIASVPLACEGWRPMKEGEMVAVRSGEILETLFI